MFCGVSLPKMQHPLGLIPSTENTNISSTQPTCLPTDTLTEKIAHTDRGLLLSLKEEWELGGSGTSL